MDFRLLGVVNYVEAREFVSWPENWRQIGTVLAPPQVSDTSKTSGAPLFHQVRSLVGSTRTELKDDAEDVPNMPRLSSSGTMGRRLYKKAHMKPAEDGSGYIVLLDNRELKTPARKPLKVPSAELALAIAAEWEWQESGIRPYTMPMMKLAATS